VCVDATGFHPYAYISLPNDDRLDIKHELNLAYSLLARELDRRVGFAEVRECTPIRKRNVYGFGNEMTVCRVEMETAPQISQLPRALAMSETLSKCHAFETDLSPELRFMIDHAIEPGGWVRATGYSTVISVYPEMSTDMHIVVCHENVSKVAQDIGTAPLQCRN